MGGAIAVTIRLSDGTEYRMLRWTNTLRWNVVDNKFLMEERTAIDRYLEPWLDMKADWDAHKEDKQFVNNMTDFYFPWAGLAPAPGYGLYVFDFQNHVIVDASRDFKYVNQWVWASIANGLRSDDDGEFERTWKGLLAEKRVTGLMMNIQEFRGQKREFKINELDWGELVYMVKLWQKLEHNQIWSKPELQDKYNAKLEEVPPAGRLTEIFPGYGRDGWEFYGFLVDMAPFKYEVFQMDPAGLTAARERVKKLGFVLSPEEDAYWDTIIEEESEPNE